MFPLTITVCHHKRQQVDENALGQPVVADRCCRRRVYGAEVKNTDDGNGAAYADRVTTVMAMYTPDGDWRDGDAVILPGCMQFEVVGDPENNNLGPFGFRPGFKVTLKRVHDGPPVHCRC